MNLFWTIFGFVTVLVPHLVSAQTFRSVVNDVTDLVRASIPVLAGAALLVFIAGLAQYIFQAGDQSSVETGRNRMIAGVVGLFVISAIWGLVTLLSSTLGLGVTPA